MKTILYILLYAPYLNWDDLIKWFQSLLKLNSDAHQFLLYFNKEWIKNKEIWHVGDELQSSILTNCALESYHKRLNSELNTSPTIENFSKRLFLFDMKNYREIHHCLEKITKYQKFLLKKNEIIKLMAKILNYCKTKKQTGNNISNEDLTNAEEWVEYNENNNDLLNDFLFGSTLDNNSEIIENQMNNILDNFHSD